MCKLFGTSSSCRVPFSDLSRLKTFKSLTNSSASLYVSFVIGMDLIRQISRRYWLLPGFNSSRVHALIILYLHCYTVKSQATVWNHDIKISLLRLHPEITASSTCWLPVSSGRHSRLPWWLAMGWMGSSLLDERELYVYFTVKLQLKLSLVTLLISLCFSRLTISSMISPSPLTSLEENTDVSTF